MSDLAPTFIPKLHKKARLRFDRHSGKHMLIYPERGLELNESATAIAKKCDGTRSIAQIIDELSAEFGDSSETREAIHADVTTFLRDLRDKGLLVSQ
jgi:coenzyme PQQ biosynthesis protein PqqD